MTDNIAIKVDNVSKTFRLPHEKQNSIKGAIINRVKSGRRTYEAQEVLKDVSFEIKKGEFFGIVGRNGSGKSTLLKMLAGIYAPTKGSITVNGKLTPFIELGVGFNPELTGRENVYLNGALLGFNRAEMNAMYKDIVEFAELEKFMDQKLKNYSSGMQVRLAFSIAIRAKSDILLIDEVLAVGDAIFQRKCFEYFKKLKRDKATVVFVSHDSSALNEYCDRGILLEDGLMVDQGEIGEVVNAYVNILNGREAEYNTEKPNNIDHRIGSGAAEITGVEIYNEHFNEKKKLLTDDDKQVGIQVTVRAHKSIENPIYGIVIFDESGRRIFAANNLWGSTSFKDVSKDEKVVVSWTIPNIFAAGTYTIEPGIATDRGASIIDILSGAATFKVRKKRLTDAITNPEYRCEVNA